MIKEKAKGFWKEHKTEIVLGGVAAITTVVGTAKIFSKGYKAGFVDGGMTGFHRTMDWFEKEFPNVKLNELYEDWKKAHPEQICYYKGPGKWETK